MTTTQRKINNEVDWSFYDYASRLEDSWRRSLPKLTDKELLQTFPGTKTIIKEKIAEWQEKREVVAEIAKKKLTIVYEKVTSDTGRWFWRTWIKLNEGSELAAIDRHIQRLKRLLVADKPVGPGRITDDDIQRALQAPIIDIAGQQLRLRKSGKNFVSLCPFHNEKSPSCFFYTETNSFYCYGCGAGGNVINYTQKINGAAFPEVVRQLVGK